MAKWADYAITGVRHESYGANNQWKRITHLQVRVVNDNNILSTPAIWTRRQVVDTRKGGKTFVTSISNSGVWIKGADVDVIRVNGEEYLRTDRNATPADNLGNLPEV